MMLNQQLQRPCLLVKAHRRTYMERRIGQKSRLPSGQPKTLGEGLHGELAAVGAQVRVECAQSAAAWQLKPVDPKARSGAWGLDRTLPSALERDTLPGQVRPRRNRGGLRAVDEI